MQNYISNDMRFEVPLYSWEDAQLPKDKLQGNNEQGVLVLCLADDIPDHLVLLKKILRSVGCDFEQDIAFATMRSGERYALLSDEAVLNNRVMIAFGIPLTSLGFSAWTGAGLFQFEDITVIHAPDLATLESSPEAKRDLWASLKYVFNT